MAKSIKGLIPTYLACKKVYPIPGGKMEKKKAKVQDLDTVSLILNKAQALELAFALLAAMRQYEKIEVKASRREKTADGDFKVTVTSPDKANANA
jgi:hypothetical protein